MSLVALVDAVRAGFAERELSGIWIGEGREAVVEMSSAGDGMTNRIVFYEGEEPGEIAAPMRIGEDDENRVCLWLIHAPIHVSISGYDAESPSRAFAHRDRCLVLWEAVAQEMQKLCAGAHTWTSWGWNTKRRHGAFGAELVATLVVEMVLRGAPYDTAKPRPLPGEPKPAPTPEP